MLSIFYGLDSPAIRGAMMNAHKRVLEIFEPAMCCSSGVGVPEVDQAFIAFAGDVDWLKQLDEPDPSGSGLPSWRIVNIVPLGSPVDATRVSPGINNQARLKREPVLVVLERAVKGMVEDTQRFAERPRPYESIAHQHVECHQHVDCHQLDKRIMLTKTDQFPAELATLAELANALSHSARLSILQILSSRDTCICGDLVDELPLAQASVSRHLKTLIDAGLVYGEIDGPRSCYCVDTQALDELRREMDAFFSALSLGLTDPAYC